MLNSHPLLNQPPKKQHRNSGVLGGEGAGGATTQATALLPTYFQHVCQLWCRQPTFGNRTEYQSASWLL
jgi:hypothetical protein